jgi:polyketide cyclase/dehydrase/lipid transport protein
VAVNDYEFVDKWRVKGTLEEVYDILSNGEDLKRWWPGIYLDAKEVEHGDESGLGRVVNFRAQGGRLLYVLNWTARTIETRKPYGFSLEASGDFIGKGVWTFEQDGDWVNVTYVWTIRAAAPILRYLSFLIKPILAENHRYAMRVGEQSLKLELARRHAHTPEERAMIPDLPPPITFESVLPALGASTAVLAGLMIFLGLLMSRRKGRR